MAARDILAQWAQAITYAFILFWLLWAAGQSHATTLSDEEYVLLSNGMDWWEVAAVWTITHGGRSKHPDDVGATDCGAHGILHFQPTDDGCDEVGLGVCSSHECPYEDPVWRSRLTRRLRRDWRRGAPVQIEAIRQEWDRAVRAAWRGTGDLEVLIVAAAINRPGLAVRIGERVGWDVDAMIQAYYQTRPNRHFRRRATYIYAGIKRFRSLPQYFECSVGSSLSDGLTKSKLV